MLRFSGTATDASDGDPNADAGDPNADVEGAETETRGNRMSWLSGSKTKGFGFNSEATAQTDRLRQCRTIIFDLICCRSRRWRRQLEANSWVAKELGPRQERKDALRHQRMQAHMQHQAQHSHHHHHEKNRCSNFGPRRICRKLGHTIQRIRDWISSGPVDAKSGLPCNLLARWNIEACVSVGIHGRVYQSLRSRSTSPRGMWSPRSPGRSPGRSPKMLAARNRLSPVASTPTAASPRTTTSPRSSNVMSTKSGYDDHFAIRIRDRSLGTVHQLPLEHASWTLRGHVLNKGPPGVLSKMLGVVGIRTEFKHEALVRQREAYYNKEFFVEIVEWVGGGSLYTRVYEDDVKIDEFSACRIFNRLVSGLQYLHGRGLIHRDIRSKQILFCDDTLNEAKLGDMWCLTRVPKKGIIMDRKLPVDVAYAAPEVLQNGHWSAKSDLWSLGCVLFEMLHGHPPHGGSGKALAYRIIHNEPEFDELMEPISKKGMHLMKSLLRRDPTHRSSAEHAQHDPWIKEFNREKPAKIARQDPHRIKCVHLTGERPRGRPGLSVENLLTSKAGTFDGGFCTVMGVGHITIDFEIKGDKNKQEEYWVTTILISLWGKAENPRSLTLSAAVRPGAPHKEVLRHEVQSAQDTSARLEVNSPLKRMRLNFQRNFGGIYGIAIRKVAFYGFQIRSVGVSADLSEANSCEYLRGSKLHTYSEELTELDVEEIHPTLKKHIFGYKRDPESGAVISAYRDICSGGPHHSSLVELSRLVVPPNVTIFAATLSLRYLCVSSESVPSPVLRVYLVIDVGGVPKRVQLFETGELPPSKRTGSTDLVHNALSVMQEGYSDYQTMYTSNLHISTDDNLHVELQFENRSGYVHVPADFGLKLHYTPELETPESSDLDEDEIKAAQKVEVIAGGQAIEDTGEDEPLQDLVTPDFVIKPAMRLSVRKSVTRSPTSGSKEGSQDSSASHTEGTGSSHTNTHSSSSAFASSHTGSATATKSSATSSSWSSGHGSSADGWGRDHGEAEKKNHWGDSASSGHSQGHPPPGGSGGSSQDSYDPVQEDAIKMAKNLVDKLKKADLTESKKAADTRKDRAKQRQKERGEAQRQKEKEEAEAAAAAAAAAEALAHPSSPAAAAAVALMARRAAEEAEKEEEEDGSQNDGSVAASHHSAKAQAAEQEEPEEEKGFLHNILGMGACSQVVRQAPIPLAPMAALGLVSELPPRQSPRHSHRPSSRASSRATSPANSPPGSPKQKPHGGAWGKGAR